jgi:hypothetical protein
MIDRRSFLKTALLGGAAFGAGVKLGTLGGPAAGERVVLHGFVPADGHAVQRLLAAFLAREDGALPAPAVDVPAAWRPAVAGALRTGADRYVRAADRVFTVQVSTLEQRLPADLLLQQGSTVLDPRSRFGRELLALREDLHGRPADVAVSCRLEPRPTALAGTPVLVVENERGVQERLPLDGTTRRLDLAGPAGSTGLVTDAGGARVVAASCRHATCRRQGVISRPGELIACAPNRLVLRVETA